uniref:Uncharacterized protein n=1 Tax=Cacopsylla melanoneura TaxID=428564 RepID=A0A8D9C0S6_9HEMI
MFMMLSSFSTGNTYSTAWSTDRIPAACWSGRIDKSLALTPNNNFRFFRSFSSLSVSNAFVNLSACVSLSQRHNASHRVVHNDSLNLLQITREREFVCCCVL